MFQCFRGLSKIVSVQMRAAQVSSMSQIRNKNRQQGRPTARLSGACTLLPHAESTGKMNGALQRVEVSGRWSWRGSGHHLAWAPLWTGKKAETTSKSIPRSTTLLFTMKPQDCVGQVGFHWTEYSSKRDEILGRKKYFYTCRAEKQKLPPPKPGRWVPFPH